MVFREEVKIWFGTMEKKLRELVNVWTNDLNHNVIPFWQKYSVDRVHGGYFTHLDENGDRYVTSSNFIRETHDNKK